MIYWLRFCRVRFWMYRILILVLLVGSAGLVQGEPEKIIIGSKKFTESYILGELMAQVLESHGFVVERRFGLGGTLVCFEALKNAGIHIYAEYSGTMQQAILKTQGPMSLDAIRREMAARHNLDVLKPFGFNNTYALAVSKKNAEQKSLKKISDLKNWPASRLGFTLEFLNRTDGWPGLREHYSLGHTPKGIEHGLAYLAIERGEIDITDAYSTDGDLERFDLVILEDDNQFFPEYLAAPFVNRQVPEKARVLLERFSNMLDETKMRALNARVAVDGLSFAEASSEFLATQGMGSSVVVESNAQAIVRHTLEHIKIAGISLLCAVLFAIPAGILGYKIEGLSKPLIYCAGLLQTIPGIALLALMIPAFGIGFLPAFVALFLYALLPILRNTVIGLHTVDPILKKIAIGMGMTGWQRLRYVELPLSAPTILAGVRTAAVIAIGTATLAAFIGAGGLGEFIVTGLALNDTRLILQGAIPAAFLAIVVELFFEGIERLFLPPHLQDRIK